eukprot:NODE_650_length_1541_cov_16.029491_g535_i0.p1 GENE.NODE_650_length_1541_cov_16.029491_g535_i0~~NODE_650_length_1541_cov_16.029491_g535_i0.p1  ORF type:complete len:497 (+),score=158.06 NODE_650_length_1541_cov_16.029491_g535_i0:25-1491(+)
MGAPDCVIVDEGHKLSNPKSCLTRALSRTHTQQRIILTGTPIQNNLWEYFTMVNFIRPGYWDRAEFRTLYANAIRNGQASFSTPEQVQLMEQRSKELYRELGKFVHRCDVTTLHSELPRKTEFTVFTTLSQLQAKLYKGFIDHSLRTCSSTSRLPTKRMLFLSAVLFKIGSHLDLARQYCVQKGVSPLESQEETEEEPADEFSFTQQDRPKKTLMAASGRDFSWARPLFVHGYKQLTLEHNNKMAVLFEIIDRCMSLGEKVLVFSQWSATLDVIEAMLRCLPPPLPIEGHDELYNCTDAFTDDGSWKPGRDYFRYDGEAGNAKRQHMAEHFNDPSSTSRLMLISMKAGGLGINLTGASRVVLCDTSWNPQADQQAIYRAYRYGQTREVFVYRLINHGTVEHTIFEKVYSKLFLFRRIVDDESLLWRRRDLDNLRLVGDGHSMSLDSESLAMDPFLQHLHQRQMVCSLHRHASLLASDDQEQLTKASQE